MRSRRVEIIAAVLVLFVSASPVMAVIEFNGGLSHDIDYEINDEVWVDFELPGLGTTLNFLEGGSIKSAHLKAFEDSAINVLGGSIVYLDAMGSSHVALSDGFIADFYAYGASKVTVSGGSIEQLYARDNCQVDVSDGSIGELVAFDNNRMTVSGGSMGEIVALLASQVDISGGSIGWLQITDTSQVTVSGGFFTKEMQLGGNTVLTIEGSDFAVDGTPVGYIELTSILGEQYNRDPHRRLTGTLLNGDPLDNEFRIGYSGKIVLVPEPATLLILALGGLALTRKRR